MTLVIAPIVLNPATHYYCAECSVQFTTDRELVVANGDLCWHLTCAEVVLVDASVHRPPPLEGPSS